MNVNQRQMSDSNPLIIAVLNNIEDLEEWEEKKSKIAYKT